MVYVSIVFLDVYCNIFMLCKQSQRIQAVTSMVNGGLLGRLSASVVVLVISLGANQICFYIDIMQSFC